MNSNYSTKKGWTSKKGTFINSIWHCDCEPRLPAEKFQTKNGGKNHGRWFLTCQRGKPKSCGFFLWSDDAKIREEGAVLSNSRSEPTSVTKPGTPSVPQTPKKPVYTAQQPTPDTRTRKRADSSQTVEFDHEDSFDWPSSDDEALAKVAAQASADLPPAQPVFETPRKAARTAEFPSPGKRTHAEVDNDTTTMMAMQNASDIFTTPATSSKSRNSGLASRFPTPASERSQTDQLQSTAPEPSALAQSALEVLRRNPIPLLPAIEQELVDLLNKHDLRTQGVTKGRDLSRVAVAAREKRIAELQNRITGLEMEKETQRQVIGHFKSDMATTPTTSPYRGRGRRGFKTPGKTGL